VLSGIFIGGRSRRMGGVPKALLRLPSGETLLERAVRVAREAGLEPVLVGSVEGARAEGVRALADAAHSRGPLGGLVALLEAAEGAPVVALACDMPRVDAALLGRIASEAPGAAVLAPRRNGLWEPLCARYDSARVWALAAARLAAGDLALQRLLAAASAVPLVVENEALLEDVDTLDDAARARLTCPPTG
jgi:molybdopterin-guanine dinucleotide biosynthesis protein A